MTKQTKIYNPIQASASPIEDKKAIECKNGIIKKNEGTLMS
jgi:hypothetical protein